MAAIEMIALLPKVSAAGMKAIQQLYNINIIRQIPYTLSNAAPTAKPK
jgi:hypothetical protein